MYPLPLAGEWFAERSLKPKCFHTARMKGPSLVGHLHGPWIGTLSCAHTLYFGGSEETGEDLSVSSLMRKNALQWAGVFVPIVSLIAPARFGHDQHNHLLYALGATSAHVEN